MRWGSLGLLQWLHALSPGLLSFQCVRRLRPRVLECRRLRPALGCLLLVPLRSPPPAQGRSRVASAPPGQSAGGSSSSSAVAVASRRLAPAASVAKLMISPDMFHPFRPMAGTTRTLAYGGGGVQHRPDAVPMALGR